MSTETRRSYATATERPTKEQAIVIKAIDKVPIDDYYKEIRSKIGPKNIHNVSKISRSRICMYVATIQLAQTLVNEHKTILIQDKRLTKRPLFSQNKRIIISNVQPFIPNDVIEKALLDCNNIRPVSGKTNRSNITNKMIPVIKTSTEQNTETNAMTSETTNMEITPPTNQLPLKMDITNEKTTTGTKRIYSETDSWITNVSDESMLLTPPIPTKEFKQRATKTNTKKKSKTDQNITKTTASISELQNEITSNPNKYPLSYLQL
ncbi:Protein of unknown function [Cotesia congregata]|uniref:Uncharacterized protein n=1 Tax=Cotesia congregata TaxID=51543 RepID=A0A8J2MRP9_COTCN|nr:Protein of unknown function [Cotesia congregata]